MFSSLSSLGSKTMSGLSSVGSWLGSNIGTIGQAAGGIGGSLGSLLGFSLGKSNSKELAAEQARLQWKYQKKAWLEGYGYQRQGLEAAGYNPLLALGGASPNSFSVSSMPSAAIPDIVGSAQQGGEIAKALSKLTQLELKEKEAVIDNIESSTLKNNVGTYVGSVSDAIQVAADVATAKAVSNLSKSAKSSFDIPLKPNKAVLKKAEFSIPKNAKGVSSIFSTLSKIAPFLLPLGKVGALGAAASSVGLGAYKAATAPYRKGSYAKRIQDIPNYGSRFR